MRFFGSLQLIVAIAAATSLIAFLSQIRNVQDLELSPDESPPRLVGRGVEQRQITDGPTLATHHIPDGSAWERGTVTKNQ